MQTDCFPDTFDFQRETDRLCKIFGLRFVLSIFETLNVTIGDNESSARMEPNVSSDSLCMHLYDVFCKWWYISFSKTVIKRWSNFTSRPIKLTFSFVVPKAPRWQKKKWKHEIKHYHVLYTVTCILHGIINKYEKERAKM